MAKVEWSRPRVIMLAGRRKATQLFCQSCSGWHKTHRAVDGRDALPKCYKKQNELGDFPHIRKRLKSTFQ